MYVSELRGKCSLDLGVEEYRHPKRTNIKQKLIKNVFWHYVALIVPFALVVFNLKEQLVELPVWLSVMTFIVWSVWYAPFLNGRRLFVKGITEKQELAYHTTFARFKAIYLNNRF